MKRIVVVGKTEAIINLNKIGIPIRGMTRAVLNIETEEQEKEMEALVRAGLLEKVDDTKTSISEQTNFKTQNETKDGDKEDSNADKGPIKKKKSGRPKGSKNRSNNPMAEERKRVSDAEAQTQKMGSRVVIATLDGVKEGHMTRSAIDDMAESDKTQASLDAMEKLQKEEDEEINLPDTPINEDVLDASEQMGRKAVIATHSGTDAVNMVNSILPEADVSKKIDPFIDRKNQEPKPEDAKKDSKDDKFDSFIEL